ncbi:MAG: hypothetical protein AB7S61_05645 [Methanoregulaceae archaeon]
MILRQKKTIPRRRDRSVMTRVLDWYAELAARRATQPLIPATPFDDL